MTDIARFPAVISIQIPFATSRLFFTCAGNSAAETPVSEDGYPGKVMARVLLRRGRSLCGPHHGVFTPPFHRIYETCRCSSFIRFPIAVIGLGSFDKAFVDQDLNIYTTVDVPSLRITIGTRRMARTISCRCEDAPHRNVGSVAQVLRDSACPFVAEFLI